MNAKQWYQRIVNFLDLKVPSTPNPTKSDDVISSDISIDSSRNLWFRLYTPSSAAASLPVLIFFHGGGFALQSAASKLYDVISRKLACSIPAIVVSVDYRLSPEHRFPCQYDDGFDTVKFIDDSVNLPLNADLSNCFLIGDSAGGNIAHHVAIRCCQTRFRAVKIVGLIAIQPFFGGEERTESELRFSKYSLVPISQSDWFWKAFLPEGENRDHAAVNVSGPNGIDISGIDGFPATVVIVGGLDTLQDWQRKYYQWLMSSGKEVELVEYSNVIHGFYCFPDFPEISQCFEKIKEFVDKTQN